VHISRILAVLLAVMGAIVNVGTQGTTHRHPGVVTNSTDGKAIDGAYAHAYPLEKDAPTPRPVQAITEGDVVAFPEVGGLHHRHERRAA
jgi:hypothetical protein